MGRVAEDRRVSLVERWRMPSGRIGTIDLDQDAAAVELLRDALRESGAELLADDGQHETKNAPDKAVAAAVEGEETETTRVGDLMFDTSVPTELAPIKPIYSDADPRWTELADWLATHEHNAGDEPMAMMSPMERAEWHVGRVLGEPNPYRRNIEYPVVTMPAAPDWAVEHDEVIDYPSHFPAVIWSGPNLTAQDGIELTRMRIDMIDPTTDEPIVGIEEVRFWLDGETDEEESIMILPLTKALAAARALLAAADALQQLADEPTAGV